MPTLAFAFLLCTLATHWIAILPTGFGGSVKYFHVAGILFACIVFLRPGGLRTLAVVQKELWPFTVALAVFALFGMLPLTILDTPYYDLRRVAKDGLAIAVGFAACVYAYDSAQRGTGRLLPWIAPIAVGLTVSLLVAGLLEAGRNPLTTIITAFQTGNTNLLIYGVFRASLVEGANSDEVQANLRHGILSGMLVALFVSTALRSQATRRKLLRDLLLLVTWLAVTAIVLISLSRSVILALGATAGAVALVGMRRTGGAKGLVLAGVSFVGLIALLLSPIGTLLYERFLADTSSYSGRLYAMTEVLDVINANPLFPGEANANVHSPHNFLLEAWVGGGAIAAIAATAMVCFVYVAWLRVFARALQRSEWPIRLGISGMLALGMIPMVRFMTAGSGLTFAEWVSLGFFLGGWSAMQSAGAHAAIPKPDANVRRPDRVRAQFAKCIELDSPSAKL